MSIYAYVGIGIWLAVWIAGFILTMGHVDTDRDGSLAGKFFSYIFLFFAWPVLAFYIYSEG